MARQTNFSAGELSPHLWGRTDLPIFGSGLRSAINFFISKQGAAVSRPGTTYVNATKINPTRLNAGAVAQGAVGFNAVRLIPFNAGEDDSFVLEFGPGYIRFHTLGATVLAPPIAPALTGLPYEVVTPYTEADLALLKYAQIGDVLTLCCPGWDPYELRHISDVPPTWSLTLAVPALLPPGYSQTVPNLSGGPPILQSNQVLTAIDRHTLPDNNFLDFDHPPQEWIWKYTVVARRKSTGELTESMPANVIFSVDSSAAVGADATPNNTRQPLTTNYAVVYRDKPVTLIAYGIIPGAIDYSDFDFVSLNVYRGRGNLFGLVGSTTTIGALIPAIGYVGDPLLQPTTAAPSFIDLGDTPNYGIPPPQGRSPFGDIDEFNAFNADPRHAQRPNAVCFFQQRRVFGGMHTSIRESDLELSQLGDFNNFDTHNLIDISGEALQVTVAARKRGKVRHLVQLRRMLILGSAWSFHGGGTPQLPLDFNSMDFELVEEVGANDVTPLVVDGCCLFVRALGRGVRGLMPAQDGFNFDGFDVAWTAEHMFRGLGLNVTDWTYSQEPWNLVWASRADGSLVSLTFDRSQKMMAWTQHSFGPAFTATSTGPDGAYVQSVCSVREGDEDAVYIVIVRGVSGAYVRYIERMTARHARGGAVLGDPLDFAAPPGLSVPPDYICLDCALPYVGAPVQVFTGLGALEGKSVYVLAQGQPVYGPFTVTGGQIDAGTVLPVNVADPASGTSKLVCYVGLLYQPQLELLDIAGGDARLKQKQVTHVGFEVDNTKGISTGQDFDHLTMAPSRTPAIGFGPPGLATGVVLQTVKGTFDLSARAVLRQTLPLPVTVVGISRRIAGGDDP